MPGPTHHTQQDPNHSMSQCGPQQSVSKVSDYSLNTGMGRDASREPSLSNVSPGLFCCPQEGPEGSWAMVGVGVKCLLCE